MRVFRDIYNAQGQFVRTDVVFDIMEATYTGQDMGKRSIVATIKYATPIDFQMGDYVEFAMQSLIRDPGHNRGEVQSPAERFYIYTEPQCKKTARPMSVGDAFETTVTFYPRQYELAGIQMRDFVQQEANAETLIYTGFDNVSFYGGAKELLDRCMACLKQYYKDSQGNPLWSYVLADALNEDKNNALERYAFSFSGNSVMDALMKLNDKDYINTTFFINGRTIYVGFKRPFLCSVNAAGAITDRPLDMMYGKTSHLPIDKTYGGLYDITKSVGEELPITKLFAYGAARNLNRYYCADRIQSGRFVNKLMLPSFSDDGTTDWIISEDAVKKYGIREGSKTFEEVYPSLRYMTYADIRGIKYCIKVRYSGLSGDVFEKDGVMTHKNSNSAYPVARVQCYQVVPCTGVEDQQTGEKDGTVGCNKLVECQPPEDLAVFIHATGKTVKVLLYGGATKAEACQKQLAHDGKIPTTDGNAPAADWSNCYAGACFAVHDIGFVDMNGQTYDATERANWFTAPFLRTLEYDPMYIPGTAQERAELHRIEYVDTFWLTDLYVMEYENGAARYDAQRSFKRDGYSAWAWPRLNDQSNFPGSLPVNEVVAVEPVTIPDTSDNINGGRQQHWDIYLRDLGFAIDEQNDFGELVFVFSTPVVSVLDGILAGREFTIDGGENLNDFQERVMCAYDENGNFNQDFMMPGDSMDTSIAQRAYLNGAIWRIRLNRNDNDSELSSIGLVIPNTDIHMKGGDHVVLLDIYMPDIYVRAAEQRLLREARNYLDKNDRGNIKYSINFDKVRFNQIQNYSRQMREGVMLRMVDEDLNISSDNKVRTIVQHTVPLETQVPFYTINSQTGPRQIDTLFEYGRPGSGLGMFKDTISSYNESQERLALKVPRASKTSEFVKIYVHGHNKTYGTYPQHQNAYAYDDNIWIVEFDCDYPLYSSLTRSNQTDVNITETIYERNEEKVYPSEGTPLPAISRDYVSFKSGKFYEVVMQVQDAYWSEENNDIILSVSPIDIETRYAIDEYECEASDPVDGWRTVTYKFRLPDSFNDIQGYYIGLYYLSPDNSGEIKVDYGAVRICSVTEKDLDAQGQSIKYVDFKASQVTIKIQDNTRPADSRIKDCYPEPIYEIQATIEEQTKASSWGSLMNNVEKTRIESEETKRTYEMLANIARQNYQQLLNLKNNIFDPDGTCNDVFIQTMMLQVGADSMNYQLDRTFTTPTGVRSNFDVSGRDVQGGTYDKFMVYDDDVLHHFVYTQGAQGGTWGVRGSFEAVLSPTTGENNETIWPTYFVCIKCRKDTDNDPTEETWICSTKQYAVNDDSDTNYWYFNWGILTANSDGFYSLMETRGNAYMYGDNLICGKISTLAGQSYFDLTHGNFVLSQGAESDAALSYINGVLTIKGFAKDEDVQNVLVQLGLVDVKATNAASAAQAAAAAASAAQQAAEAAQQAVDNVTNDGIISKGTEKQELNREFIIIAGNTRDGESADGSYSKAIAQANQYGVDHTALDLAFQDLYAALKIVLGTGSNGKIDGSNIQNDTYIGGNFTGTYNGQTYDNQPRYDMNLPYGTNLYTNTDPITIGTLSVSTGVTMASGVKYNFFVVSKTGNANPIAVVEDRGYSHPRGTLGGWYSPEKNLSVNGTGAGGACKFIMQGPSSNKVTAKGIAIRTFSDINSAKFNELWKLYYDAEIALLNAVEAACAAAASEQFTNLWPIDEEVNLTLADRETHLLGYILADHFNRGDKFVMSYEIKNYSTDEPEPYNAGIYFDFRVKYIDGDGDEQTYWYDYDGQMLIKEDGKHTGTTIVSGIIEDIENAEDVTVQAITEIMVYVEPHLDFASEASFTIYHGMIVSGNKPGNYSLAYKHLADALKGTTEIVGGLTMTNLLLLKDEDGSVKAGMSGLRDYKIENGVIKNHGVTLFSGGDYEKALQQAQAAALGTLDQLTSLLPVLLTKTGIGSNIGCFRVLSDTAVEVVSKNGGRIVIDAGNASSSPSIKFFDTNGDCLININGNALPTINVDSKSISSYSWYVAHDFYSGTVLATESLTQSASYRVTYNGANNIKIAGFSMGLYAASGVKATGYDIYFELYFGEKKIATASFYDSTTVYSDGSMYANLYIGISKFYSISQGTYSITVRNLRARMINKNGSWQNAGWTRIDGLYFGNGTSNSGWTDGNILFSTQSENSITLGKNGLLITSSGGGVTEFRNRETNNYVRFIGLPNSATDNGQLYKDTNGNLKVRV